MNKRISVVQTINFYRALEIEKTLLEHTCQILTSIDEINSFSDEGDADTLKAKNKILEDLTTIVLDLLTPGAKKYNSNANHTLLKETFNEILTSIAYSVVADEIPIENQDSTYQRLIQAIVKIGRNFIVNFETIESRVQQHSTEINDLFFSREAIDISTIEFTNSDPHNSGKRVAIITFKDGNKLVYKPRQVRADNQIVGDIPSSVSSTINQAKDHVQFKHNLASNIKQALSEIKDVLGKNRLKQAYATYQTDKAISLPTYKFLELAEGVESFGFVEYLSYTESDKLLDNKAEARAYYRQLGSIAAIARIFGITDLHQENMIVHKKSPHLSDLEFTYDYRTLTGIKTSELTLKSGACLFGESSTNVVEMHGIDKALLHEKYIGDIMLGFIEVITALKLANMSIFFRELPPVTRVRCGLVPTATFKNWPVQIILGTNTMETYTYGLLDQLPKKNYRACQENQNTFQRQLASDLEQFDTPIFYQRVSDHGVYHQSLRLYDCLDPTSTEELIRLNISNGMSLFFEFKLKEIDPILSNVSDANINGCCTIN